MYSSKKANQTHRPTKKGNAKKTKKLKGKYRPNHIRIQKKMAENRAAKRKPEKGETELEKKNKKYKKYKKYKKS